MSINKKDYLKYKKSYASMQWNITNKNNEICGYKVVEDYKYSPDGSLSILLKNKVDKIELIWNETFLSFESIYDDLELSKKINDKFFEFFRYTFNSEYKEFEGRI